MNITARVGHKCISPTFSVFTDFCVTHPGDPYLYDAIHYSIEVWLDQPFASDPEECVLEVTTRP